MVGLEMGDSVWIRGEVFQEGRVGVYVYCSLAFNLRVRAVIVVSPALLARELRIPDSKDKATYPVICLILGKSIPSNREKPPPVAAGIPSSVWFMLGS